MQELTHLLQLSPLLPIKPDTPSPAIDIFTNKSKSKRDPDAEKREERVKERVERF
jgi:hypothetical protein